MPKELLGHAVITVNKNLVVIGGWPSSSSLHRLTCQNQNCEWKTISNELKIGRYRFVAMAITRDNLDCGN